MSEANPVNVPDLIPKRVQPESGWIVCGGSNFPHLIQFCFSKGVQESPGHASEPIRIRSGMFTGKHFPAELQIEKELVNLCDCATRFVFKMDCAARVHI